MRRNLDRILAEAEDMMRQRIAACIHRAHKDAARRMLAGGDPAMNVRERPLLIARRYIRFLAHIRRGRLH